MNKLPYILLLVVGLVLVPFGGIGLPLVIRCLGELFNPEK
jgi:hypothetical protein